MLNRVVKPFSYSEDGLALVDLSIGDERDFGDLAAGLAAEGFIEAAPEHAEAAASEKVEVATDAAPIETRPEPRRRGR